MRICAPVLAAAAAVILPGNALAQSAFSEGIVYSYDSLPVEYGSAEPLYLEESSTVYTTAGDPYAVVEDTVTVVEGPSMFQQDTVGAVPSAEMEYGTDTVMTEVIEGIVYETVVGPAGPVGHVPGRDP